MKNIHHTINSHILLFEDEDLLRRSINFTLKRQGYSIVAYETVDDASDMLRKLDSGELKISLVITDLQLPGKSGYDLINMLIQSGRTIPILVICGYNSREVQCELKKLNVTDVLDKPFCVEELVLKVESIIKRTKRADI